MEEVLAIALMPSAAQTHTGMQLDSQVPHTLQ
jgi:hypothetical protein